LFPGLAVLTAGPFPLSGFVIGFCSSTRFIFVLKRQTQADFLPHAQRAGGGLRLPGFVFFVPLPCGLLA
jgi:hypothetical protein